MQSKWQRAKQPLLEGSPWEGQKGMRIKGHEETFSGKNVFSIVLLVIILLVYGFVKAYQIVHLKYVQFIVC